MLIKSSPSLVYLKWTSNYFYLQLCPSSCDLALTLLLFPDPYLKMFSSVVSWLTGESGRIMTVFYKHLLNDSTFKCILFILFYNILEWYDFLNSTFFYIRSVFLQLLSHNIGFIIVIARLVISVAWKCQKHNCALNDHQT